VVVWILFLGVALMLIAIGGTIAWHARRAQSLGSSVDPLRDADPRFRRTSTG
jgi:hypothetical protein